MPHRLDRAPSRTALIASVLVAMVAIGLYSRAPANGFVGWDDDVYVTGNLHLRDGLTPAIDPLCVHHRGCLELAPA